MSQALEGIRVIDIGTFQAAPFCCQLLADFGAEVIRVEPPGGAIDRELGPFAAGGQNLSVPLYNRNKKGITLNLQAEKGKALLDQLVVRSDVLVTNMTSRAVKGLGIGYSAMSRVNQGIIYASLTGFGQNGPYAERPAFDMICQAIAGHMYITGFKGAGPTKSGSSFCDFGAGLYCAIGVLLALRHRDRTGRGQEVDVALLDTAVSFMEAVFAQFQVLQEVQPQMGNARPFSAPTDSFRCKDGYVYLAITFDRMWQKFTQLIGREDLGTDPRFASSELRRRNRDYMNSVAGDWLADKTRAEAVNLLVQHGIPAAPVNTVTEAFADPQIKARNMIVDVDQPGIGKIPVSGVVVKMSGSPGLIRTPAPAPGQHNREIYCDRLGCTEADLAELSRTGII
ncbi:MAG: CoA transferase [Chloroflexi bacterium]|nr:CoA transferase [Chloroflexota bacterium]